MTLHDFKDFFAARFDQLQRMAMAHFPPTHYRHADREELTAVAMAICWRWSIADFVAGNLGEDSWVRIKNNLYYAIKQARSGRELPEDMEKGSRSKGSPSQDFYSFKVKKNRHRIDEVAIYFCSADTPIPDQVAFRIDFPAFLDTLTERQRLIIGELIKGTSTTEIAHIFGVTIGRISQMKREFKDLMDRFFGE